MCVRETYWDFNTPQLSSHFTSHLKCNLCGHSHEGLWTAQSPGEHTLAGDGTVHTQILLNVVVLVLPAAGKDHHHLTDRHLHQITPINQAPGYPLCGTGRTVTPFH